MTSEQANKNDIYSISNGSQTHTSEMVEENNKAKPVDTNQQGISNQSGVLQTLKDYSAESNFHGIKYVFAAATILGRFLWLLLFLAACAGFLYQLCDRIITYHRHPVNVNIEVKRNDSLNFPAVVFCNTNQYRMTVAESMGIYDALRSFYTSSPARGPLFKSASQGESEASATLLDKLDMKKISEKLAHQKEDFIHECRFGSTQCSALNFTTQVTDFGICFVFNDRKQGAEILKTRNKGSNHGLTVVFNLEQYEYMPGPSPDAGIKLLVYNQGEPPLVDDLGISIPAESNGIVGIQMSKLFNLPPPHGKCGERKLDMTPVYSDEACRLECITYKAVEKCRCRDFYMPWKSDSQVQIPYCNISTLRDCMASMKGMVIDSCNKNCPPQCEETSYISSVSYSRASDFETSKMAAYINGERHDIGKKYLRARVSAERLNKDTVKRDSKLIKDLFKAAEKLKMSLINNGNNTANHVIFLLEKIKLDITGTLMTNLFSEAVKVKKELQVYIDDYNTLFGTGDMQNFIGDVQMNGGLMLYYLQIMDTQLSRPGQSLAYNITYKRIQNIQDELDSVLLFQLVFAKITEPQREIFEAVLSGKWDGTWHNQTYKLPTFRMKQSMTNTSHVDAGGEFVKAFSQLWQPLTNYTQCVRTLNSKYIPVPSIKLINVSQEHSANLSNGIQACKQLWTPVARLVESVLVPANSQYHNAIRSPIRPLEELSQALITAERTVQVTADGLMVAIAKFTSIMKDPQLFINDTLRLINNSVQYLHLLYKWQNVSKAMLIDKLLSQGYTSESAENEIKHFLARYDELLYQNLVKAVDSQANLISLLKQAKEEMQEMWMSEERIQGLLEQGRNHQTELKRLESNIETQAKKFFDEHSSFVKMLRSFASSLSIRDAFYQNNFLKVNVYYQKVEYQEIQRNIGYSWFSLLCDIGGSAGLFLGASLLTMAELFYFMVSHFMTERDKEDNQNRGDVPTNTHAETLVNTSTLDTKC